MNKNGNIQTFLGCDKDYNSSKIVIFGAPFDSTTSYRPGTRFASKTMRAESYGFETYSPYQDKDLSESFIYDAGDIDLPFGDVKKALDIIESDVREILADGKVPVMIGGEHLVSLPAVSAAIDKYPNLCVMHFDAHADLRDDYLGQKLSHASVMRRIWDRLGDGRIFQFGIRSGEREEFEWGKSRVFTNKYDFSGLEDIIKSIGDKPVYLSVDLDVLDPSCFPGTGTPEAGGVDFVQLNKAVLEVCNKLKIIGADINELAPNYDHSGASTAVACKILRELLIAVS